MIHPAIQEEGRMQITELAEAFDQIEATTKRGQITALLAEVFHHGREDAGILPYLLQGRLGPPFAAPTIGMDEGRIGQAIALASSTSEADVRRRYKERGDLGLVAEILLSDPGERVPLREVFERLASLAAISGAGAAERKVTAFQGLLRRLAGREARYVVRIALGKLRLGIGDATIMDALSLASAGDSTLRPHIERAYNFCADLGFVASILFTGGVAALEAIHPAPGRPVLSALAERLASPEEIISKLGSALAEPKYDGLRLQAQKDGDRVWLFTRRLEDVTHAFPEIVHALRRQSRVRRLILDGEAISYDPTSQRLLPFQETARRRRKHGVDQAVTRYPLRYYVFDLLFCDGEDLTSLPQRERSSRLRLAIQEESSETICITPQVETATPDALRQFFEQCIRQGLEGVVVKRPDAPYHAGQRQFTWVKLKRSYQVGLADTFDVVVVGYYRGRGRRARLGIGSLLCAVYDPVRDRYRTITRVGSGLSDAEWTQLRETLDTTRVPARPWQVDSALEPDVWVQPRYVLEVLAGEITRSPMHTAGKISDEPGYALRFPRVIRLRPDRRPEDATTEADVIALYHLASAQSGATRQEAHHAPKQ
jgi:DNA ligase-1